MILSGLLYKDDWDAARQRMEAWYRCEIIDRCMIEARDVLKKVPAWTRD